MLASLAVAGFLIGQADGELTAMTDGPSDLVSGASSYLSNVSTGLLVVLSLLAASRVHQDRASGWLVPLLTVRRYSASTYVAATFMTAAGLTLLSCLTWLTSYAITFATTADARPAGFTRLAVGTCAASLCWTAFGTVVGTFTRSAAGWLLATMLLVVMPVVLAAWYAIKFDVLLDGLARQALFVFIPATSLRSTPSTLAHHLLYTAAALVAARVVAMKTLGRA